MQILAELSIYNAANKISPLLDSTNVVC